MKTYSVMEISCGLVTCVAEDNSRVVLPAVSLPKNIREGDILRFEDNEVTNDKATAEKKRQQMLQRQKALMRKKKSTRR